MVGLEDVSLVQYHSLSIEAGMPPLIPKELTDDPAAYALLVFVGVILAAGLVTLVRPWYQRSCWKPVIREYLRTHRVVFLCMTAGFIGTVYFGGDLGVRLNAVLEADMEITAGQTVGAYLNDTDHPPRQIPVIPNVRNTYRWDSIPASLKYIRIDPSNAAAKIAIYSISVVSEGHVIRRFTPAELKSWTLYNLVPGDGDPSAYNVTSINVSMGDFLATPVSVEVSSRPAWLLYTIEKFRTPRFYSLAILGFFLVFLLAGLSSTDGLIEASCVAAVVILAPFVARLAMKFPASPPAIKLAVGNASYTGYRKFDDHLISWAILAVCVMIAVIAARVRGKPSKSLGVSAGESRSVFSLITPLVILLVITLLYLPDFRAILEYLKHITYRPIHWDYANFLFWQYLAHRGYLPFRDYWYPYAGFYTGSLPFPAGYLWSAAESIFALWFLFLGLRIAVGKRAGLAVFVPVLIGVGLNEFAGWYRYGLGVTVIVFYIGLLDLDRFTWRRPLLIAIVSGFTFFLEPTQLIYAGFGILAHTSIRVLLDAREGPNGSEIRARLAQLVRQRLVFVLMPISAGVFIVLCWLTAKGMLPGFVRFHLSLSDQYAAAAKPADVLGWSLPALRFETMFMLLFFVLVLSLYTLLRDRQWVSQAYAASAAVGFAGLMAMQKNIMRPPILEQVEIYPCIAVLLYTAGAWPRRTRLQTAAIGFFLGVALGVAEYRGVLVHYYRVLANGPSIGLTDWRLMRDRQTDIQAVNASLYAPSRFTGYPQQKAVLEVLQSDFGWKPSEPIFVLGDDQVFYMLTGGSFPYVANNYNGSSLTEQRHILQWVQTENPRFVVWNSSILSFDDVPDPVRVPLLYQFVREHYRFLKTVGPYDILTASAHPADDDADYWIRRLGSKLDLGSVPRLTNASAFHPCPVNRQESCQVIAIVHLKEPHRGKAVLTVDSVAGPFELPFDVAEGQAVYVFDLDRLWFRRFLRPNTSVRLSIPASESATELRLRDSGTLY